MKLNLVITVVTIFALLLFAIYAMNLPWTPLRIAGIAILLPSFILLSIARMQLGRSLSLKAKATELVTTGIYSRIRNPIYLFGALTILGFIIWTGKPILLLVYVVLIPMQTIRARKESAVLVAKFGDAYLRYRKNTWF
jgi:protein-S-isoprenylcysteine O-methyltransferase Ste14